MELHPVLSGRIAETLPPFLEQLNPSKIFVLVDDNTEEHCLPVLAKALVEKLSAKQVITIAAGELNKTLPTVSVVWEKLIEQQADRHALVINLGGGVVTDLGGYAAGCYKRGIRFLHIPTTVLGMVDAALGGKTGVDHGGIKNSVGLFQMPQAVLTDTQFLATLPARELRSGMAEMYKHALIHDHAQWEELKATTEVSDALISKSQQVKLDIVAADPFEKGLREALNYGHSVGHAIESLLLETSEPLLHGEAIAAGMICEAYLSELLCGLEAEAVQDIEQTLLSIYGHAALSETQQQAITELVANDKKNRGGRIRMSLLHKIGTPALGIEVQPEQIKAAVSRYLKLG
ncbi:MAG: 3-dehydroquinate synthase [Saprospiraceae bacterium]